LRARSFTLDGEAVVCGPDGVAVFEALHRRGTVSAGDDPVPRGRVVMGLLSMAEMINGLTHDHRR
jgi:hypothetical protein